jgi:DNA-binding NarL/FixJ family response regulator
VNEILLSEAEGYILKNTSREEFFNAIDRLLDNNTYYSKEVLSILLNRVKKEAKISNKTKQLTERELEIVKLIAMEYSSEQIAEKLFISKHTVDTHRKNILQKTETRTLVGLIRFAYENSLL